MTTPLISVKELAAALGVSDDTIRRAAWRRTIPSFRIGKILRFDMEAVRETIQQPARLVHRHGPEVSPIDHHRPKQSNSLSSPAPIGWTRNRRTPMKATQRGTDRSASAGRTDRRQPTARPEQTPPGSKTGA
jgi:excisionase family DNA binding protein